MASATTRMLVDGSLPVGLVQSRQAAFTSPLLLCSGFHLKTPDSPSRATKGTFTNSIPLCALFQLCHHLCRRKDPNVPCLYLFQSHL